MERVAEADEGEAGDEREEGGVSDSWGKLLSGEKERDKDAGGA